MNPTPAPTLCIHCGLEAGHPPRLNRFEDGRVCPACADRLLASLPPVLPADVAQVEADPNDYESEYQDYGEPDFDRPA
jgi:hypothetical protein